MHVAFVIDTYARKIIGWLVGTSAHAGFVLGALEKAVYQRCPTKDIGLVHHSNRGSQGGFNRPPKPKQTSTQLWKPKPWPRN
ncbi:hypothetical protein [Cypionkella sp.]|uniref:hypothetical protein n=1 Tax=Cypionkella sp. TaxID=2811411 RepID=UPI0039FCEA66